MAITLNSALTQLAKYKKTMDAAKKRQLAERESDAEKMDYAVQTGIRVAGAVAGGAADAMVADTMAGIAPAELAGLALGGLSFFGVLGPATKPARAFAEGAIIYSAGRRSFAWFGGDSAGTPLLTGGGVVSGEISADEEVELIAMQEQLERAAELVD
jgi:hypothetical protein